MTCVNREDWGACGTVPREDVTAKDEVQIHHSVSPNKQWTRQEEITHLHQLCQGHMDRGFATIGYSWLVFPSGRCYVGRGMGGIPAAAEGQNSGTWAICLIGDFRTTDELRASGIRNRSGVEPTVEARREARRLIVKLRDEHGAEHLGGHREFPSQGTECPGGRLLALVRKWRDDFHMTRPEAT